LFFLKYKDNVTGDFLPIISVGKGIILEYISFFVELIKC